MDFLYPSIKYKNFSLLPYVTIGFVAIKTNIKSFLYAMQSKDEDEEILTSNVLVECLHRQCKGSIFFIR